MSYKLAPSILSADVAKLGEQIKEIDDAGADLIHIDVMDGVFVPNISYGIPVVAGLRGLSDNFFDVHLMITKPFEYISKFVDAGADGITVHVESETPGLDEVIDEIIRCGAKPALAISPDTPIDPLVPVIDRLDMVLVMTVHPGYGGQKIIKDTFFKVAQLRKLIDERGLKTQIQVDGGITLDNIEEVKNEGADIFVAGTAVFKGNIADNMKQFKKLLG
ncbi:MAG: ribulose-phosphate 3-epimerase [Eubacterium sp.]|nr:ribulose-phosphate 3-epimerase [Eubacterium sp.]